MPQIFIFTRENRFSTLFQNIDRGELFLRIIKETPCVYSLSVDDKQLILKEFDPQKQVHFCWDGGLKNMYADEEIVQMMDVFEDTIEDHASKDGTVFLMHTRPIGALKDELIGFEENEENKTTVLHGVSRRECNYFGTLAKIIEQNLDLSENSYEQVIEEIVHLFAT